MKIAKRLLLLALLLAGAVSAAWHWLRPAAPASPTALHGAVPVLHKTPRPADGPKTVRRVPGRRALS